MSDRTLASSILGGAVVVIASGAAAFLGARLARRDAPNEPTENETAPASADPAVGEGVDRRISYLEKRVEMLEDAVRTATELGKHDDLRIGGAPPVATQAPKVADVAAPAKPEDQVKPKEKPLDVEDKEDVIARFQGTYRANQRGRLIGEMALLADTSRDGPANRAAQALGDAHTLMASLGLRGDAVRDKFVAVFKDRLDAGARDIGPIVRDGLERTDIATVRARLKAIDAEADRRLREILDDDAWKRYEQIIAAPRQATDAVLDEFEKARLGVK